MPLSGKVEISLWKCADELIVDEEPVVDAIVPDQRSLS